MIKFMPRGIKPAFKIFSPWIFWLMPRAVQAQGFSNKYNFPDPLAGADIPTAIGRLISAALSLTGGIFFIMFLWGGWMWMTAGGGKDKVQKSITTLRNAVIGLVIVAAAYAVTTFVIDTIVRGAGAGPG